MIHVAIMRQPYLDLILTGKKTVESRLTIQARDPFEAIEPGERIYFKQSAGPYRATAIAEHVLFERDLTPKRINEIRRDYNALICGEPAYWRAKRESCYCTLIWFKDVQPIDAGPAIRPMQGAAWLVLEEEPAWRRATVKEGEADLFKGHAANRALAPGSFFIEVTAGNLRNNTLYATSVIERFPPWAFGGKTKAEAARPITLILHEGPTIRTDIVSPRAMFRSRAWGAWFRTHGVQEGDRVVFTPMDEATYFVGLAREQR